MAKIKKSYIFLAVIILVQIVFYCVIFSTQKTAYHEDEFFSYGLSNSYNRPFLYGSDLQVFDNYNVWQTGDDFKYYIETNDETNFSYGSVWSNQATDTAPPFYYAVLHTISSFFPEQFSWWWGFGINLICFGVTQIFLFKISSRLSKSDFLGLIICIFWGFSVGGQYSTLYIRMYCMLTMFVVMFIYFSSRLVKIEKANVVKDLLPLAAVTFFGAMTHHLFLVIAFFYTAFMCIYYLLKRKFKSFFIYALTVLIPVLLSFAAFPATIKHLFFNNFKWGGEPDIRIQLHLLFRLMVRELTGYKMSVYQNDILTYVLAILVCVIVLMIPLIVLFRNEKWLKNRVEKIKLWFNNSFVNYDFTVVITLFSVIAFLVMSSVNFYYDDIGEYADRYLFMLYPLIIMIAVVFLYKICSLIKAKKAKNTVISVVCCAICATLVYQNVTSNKMYSMDANTDNGKIDEYVADNDCIMLVSSPVYLPCYSQMMMNSGDIYISLYTSDIYKTQNEQYQKLFDSDDVVYLLFDTNDIETDTDKENSDEEQKSENNSGLVVDENVDLKTDEKLSETELVEYFEDLSGFKATYCTSENTHFCTAKLYKFERK